MNKKIGIIGAGPIGLATAEMLCNQYKNLSGFSKFRGYSVDITLADVILPKASYFVDTEQLDVNDHEQLTDFVKRHDAIISAAPFYLNKLIASNCAVHNKSYFDFTEDAETTQYIKIISEYSEATFVPQCGLAPGIINIIGADLLSKFEYTNALHMRVGALPRASDNTCHYYRTWSTHGLVNEYIKDCDAIVNGFKVKTRALDSLEIINIDGTEYECFNTSGGVATMCDTYQNSIAELNYKTIRYPGHNKYLKFFFNDLNMATKQELATEIFDELPITDDDVVILYVKAEGYIDNKKVTKIYSNGIYSAGNMTAIQRTTAAGMVAVIELYLDNKLTSGFIAQENISFEQIKQTHWFTQIYGDC